MDWLSTVLVPMRRWTLLGSAIATIVVTGECWAGLDEAKAALKEGNYKSAMREVMPLAKAGDAKAQALVALMYEDGMGVARDPVQASHWYEASALQGVVQSQYLLGLLNMQSQELGAPNPEEAARWLTLAAQQGHANSQLELAKIYARPGVDEAALRRSVSWLRIAADQGSAGAQHLLAQAYLAGRGVERSAEQAYFWAAVAMAGGWWQAGPLKQESAAMIGPAARRDTQLRIEAWRAQQAPANLEIEAISNR